MRKLGLHEDTIFCLIRESVTVVPLWERQVFGTVWSPLITLRHIHEFTTER